MAEQEMVWNKPLLLVAFLLGVLAAVLFFVYDWSMQKKLSGDMVNVLQWRDDFPVGRRVTAKDVDRVAMRREHAKHMAGKGVLTEDDLVLLTGKHATLSRSVQQQDWVKFTDVMGDTSAVNGAQPRSGMRKISLPVDPKAAPAGLRVHDRVDLLALLSVPGKGTKAYTVLKNVRVLGVGSRTEEDENAFQSGGAGYRATGRSYRNVTVEVAPRTVEMLVEVLDRIRGGRIWVSVRPLSNEQDDRRNEGELNPEVTKLLGRGLVDRASD